MAAVLLVGSLGAPAGALAQSDPLSAPAITKEQAREARQASNSSGDDGFRISLELGLLISGFVVMGGAALYIVRDSRGSVGAGTRPAPGRPVGPDAVGRGAPKNMFGSDTAAGAGKHGRRKKRDRTKRQKAARRRNR